MDSFLGMSKPNIVERYIRTGIHMLDDIFFNIKDIAKEQYDILLGKSKAMQLIDAMIKPLICDVLIATQEIGIYKSIIFNQKERLVGTEQIGSFCVEFKKAHKTTVHVLNRLDADLDINHGDIFVEIHLLHDMPPGEKFGNEVKKLISTLKQISEEQYEGKVSYILGVSDLAKYATRYGFSYEELDRSVQNRTMLYYLKHGFVFKNVEVVGHWLDKQFHKSHYTNNPQLAINKKSRKEKPIGLCWYKL